MIASVEVPRSSVEIMRIDLHAHSNASDGTDTPAELVENAVAAGLDVIAITDHDTTRGWDAAAEAATRFGIALVRGIEISCKEGGRSVHLLGYLPRPEHPELVAELDRARDSRDGRARRIVDRLAADVPITWEGVASQVAGDATIGRPHIADALVAAGVVPDRSAAFNTYLHDGSPYYEGHYAMTPERAVQLVRAAGGVPVLAHPFGGRRGIPLEERRIAELAEAGLFGIEAHHVEHGPAQQERALAIARDLDLVVTGSSDYHGDGKPNRLGDHTTSPEALAAIEEAATGTPVVHP